MDHVRPTDQFDGIHLSKENQDITIIGKLIWNSNSSRIDKIDFFTFTNITMEHDTQQDMYPYTIYLVLELLKKQKEKIYPLLLNDGAQQLSICRLESPKVS